MTTTNSQAQAQANFQDMGIRITHVAPSAVKENVILLFAESNGELDRALAWLRCAGRPIEEILRVRPEDDSDGEGYVEIRF